MYLIKNRLECRKFLLWELIAFIALTYSIFKDLESLKNAAKMKTCDPECDTFRHHMKNMFFVILARK